MAFPTDDILLGAPQYGDRKGDEGICFHTTEGAGPSRAAAVATATWQASPQNTSGGSYNFIIYDGGVLLTVPYLVASGGISTKRTNPPWDPEPWLKTMLSAAAYADPNAYLLQIAFSGKAADLAAGSYPDNMIDTAARLIIWFEEGFGKDNAVIMAHADWQTNRTDPGVGVVARIMARYNEIKNPTPVLTCKEKLALAEAEITRLKGVVREVRSDLRAARARIAAVKEALA